MQFYFAALSLQGKRKVVYLAVFKFLFLWGEVSPYAATPRFARVCVYPLRGDTPRRPVQFLAKQNFAAAQP
jgi:hypothetical protein